MNICEELTRQHFFQIKTVGVSLFSKIAKEKKINRSTDTMHRRRQRKVRNGVILLSVEALRCTNSFKKTLLVVDYCSLSNFYLIIINNIIIIV